MSTIPIFNGIRIIPRESDFLNRKFGARGEIFYDKDADTLRLYSGTATSGISLARADLQNVTNAAFSAKAAAAGIGGGGGGNTTVTVSDEVPASPEDGNLWLNTNNGVLYVYVDDGDSEQWIQPATPVPTLAAVATSGDYDDLTNTPTLASVATSGDYDDLTNSPTNVSVFTNDIGYLTDIPDAIKSTILADDSTLLIDAASGEINTYALSQVSATDGQALVWNTSNSRWQPGGDFVSPSGTQTLTNKRINPRSVNASATSGTITPDGNTTDIYVAEGLTSGITINTPSGTPVNGQKLLIRLKDDGTGRSITWTTTSGAFRAVGITLPTTTVATKTSYVGCVYNSADSFWDAIAVVTQA